MPFSTDKGEGFENRLAELLADKLRNDKVTVRHFDAEFPWAA
jgi:hypothetical protein